jgi:hypothetical protein
MQSGGPIPTLGDLQRTTPWGRFDRSRVYTTVALPQYADGLPYNDPRTEEGELMWPERFDDRAVTRLESQLGPCVLIFRRMSAHRAAKPAFTRDHLP